MKSFIIVLTCLVAVTLAVPDRKSLCKGCSKSNDRPDWCRPCDDDGGIRPPAPGTCLAPDCSDNRLNQWLFPNIDPNFYWQCNPIIGGWEALKRPCACGTLFDFEKQACVHRHEWTGQCPGQPTNPTVPACPSCPNCGPTGDKIITENEVQGMI